jgi:Mg2+ and Co2+ transporter CorA
MSLLFSPNYLSPMDNYLSPMAYSPVSQIKVTPYSTQITTANVFTPYPYNVRVDTGLNSSWIVQKDTAEWLWYRILDKWFYSDELCHLLKYLKITNGKVEPIASQSDYKNNKICSDSLEDVEKKTDYIEENMLGLKDMKKLLQRIIAELDYQWTDLIPKEKLVVEVVERHLRKQLQERIGTK